MGNGLIEVYQTNMGNSDTNLSRLSGLNVNLSAVSQFYEVLYVWGFFKVYRTIFNLSVVTKNVHFHIRFSYVTLFSYFIL